MSNNSYSSYREGNRAGEKKRPAKKASKNKKLESKKKVASKSHPTNKKKAAFQQRSGPRKQAAAPKISRAEEKKQKQERARLKQEQKTIQRAHRQENRKLIRAQIADFFKKTFFVLLVLVLIAEAILMLNQNATIDTLKFEINDLNEAYKKEKNILKELNSQKEAALKSETIENIARYNLGMVYPTKEQTIYINLD